MFHEVNLFLLGIVTGAVLSMLFDFFRALRKIKMHSVWAVAVEDIFFWLSVLVTLFLVIHIFNQGILRFYIFWGCVLGSCFYYLTIGKLVFPVLCMGFGMVKRILSQSFLIFVKFRKIFKNYVIFPLKNLWERIKILCNNI